MRDTLFRQDAVDFNRTSLIGDALTARGIRAQRLTILYHALNGALFGVENIAVVSLGALAVLDGGFSVGMRAGSRAPCRTVALDDGRSRDRGRTRRHGFALNFNSSSTDEAFTSIQ
jgi:hypothetical protein